MLLVQMVFSSSTFLFYFLPIFLVTYYLSKSQWRSLVLTVFSYIFYGWWSSKFILLIFASTVIDYWCGERLYRASSKLEKKKYLLVSIIANMSMLGFFKYFNFFTEITQSVISILGFSNVSLPLLEIILPVGISFYTFQSMSYTIDIYREKAKPTGSFIIFASYISMFPQLVAGPIVRFTHLDKQLKNPILTFQRFYLGLQFFILGLAKKVLIADVVAIFADKAFDPSLTLSSVESFIGVVAYSVQIYFDFSGYSDMAVGLGYFCGFVFPINFNSPYKAISMTDFWRRWHITLSTWLRDYLYIPLGGSHNGKVMTYRNLSLTMLLGGLWHGASWSFIIWGAIHGVVLATERALGEKNLLKRLPVFLQILTTYLLVCFAWIFFRAVNLPEAFRVINTIFSMNFYILEESFLYTMPLRSCGLALGLLIIFFFKNTWEVSKNPSWYKTTFLIIILIVSIIFLFGLSVHPFLYFQF